MKNPEDEKPLIGRPPKFKGGSALVSARISQADFEKLIKKFGSAGVGVQKAVEAFLKLNKGKK